jgi:hypothetical protein
MLTSLRCRNHSVRNRYCPGDFHAVEILTNPWVIGIGTAVIAGLILRFVFGIGKSKPKHDQAATITESKGLSKSPLVPTEQLTNDITPQHIMDYLGNLPPLQKDSAGDHYKVINVSWLLTLRAGHKLENGKLRLMMRPKGKAFPWVYCQVDPNQYPVLRVIKETQELRVDGEIKGVSGHDIYLKNCRLSI